LADIGQNSKDREFAFTAMLSEGGTELVELTKA
jgi:hypothetical protein